MSPEVALSEHIGLSRGAESGIAPSKATRRRLLDGAAFE